MQSDAEIDVALMMIQNEFGERMKKFWRLLRVGGASLRWWRFPDEVRKYDDLSWDDVTTGQCLFVVAFVAPLLTCLGCVLLGWEWVGVAFEAIEFPLITLLVRPVPKSAATKKESRIPTNDELNRKLQTLDALIAHIEARAKEDRYELDTVNNKE